MPINLLMVGASIRAAAHSAVRAGFQPWGADLFGDLDARLACAPFHQAADYPGDFLVLARNGPAGPWMYTGALENRPDLVEMISRARPLWGNPAEVLRAVRSPRKVFEALREMGVPCPATYDDPASVPDRGRWLMKPRRGAGGRGIAFWDKRAMPRSVRGRNIQEFIDGEACAAVFVGDNKGATLLGVTRQLVGEAWLNAAPFQYCGSIGPLVLPASLEQAYQRLGNALATGFRLQGIFGVDCVVAGGIPWPVEVNPRYTASVEVLELSHGIAALARQQQVFDPAADSAAPLRSSRHGVVGKAILYSRIPLVFPDDGPWRQALAGPFDPWALPAFADIPPAGHKIAQGRPIFSFFATAASPSDCLRQLAKVAGTVFNKRA